MITDHHTLKNPNNTIVLTPELMHYAKEVDENGKFVTWVKNPQSKADQERFDRFMCAVYPAIYAQYADKMEPYDAAIAELCGEAAAALIRHADA